MSIPTLVLFALVSQDPIAPDIEAQFRDLVDSGLEAYEARRFDEAATQFLEAYALIPEPELIYNAARSFEKSLQRERAIEQYETFLTLEGTTARLRSKALDALKLLRRELEALRPTEAPTTRSPPTQPPEPGPAVVATPPPGPNRALEVTLLSTGGAALVAGGVFGVLALQARADFDDATGSDRIEQRDEAERFALISDVLMASGAALAATGVVLFIVKKPRRNRIGWSPVAGPGGFGIAGSF